MPLLAQLLLPPLVDSVAVCLCRRRLVQAVNEDAQSLNVPACIVAAARCGGGRGCTELLM
jgi:hypothetical protein